MNRAHSHRRLTRRRRDILPGNIKRRVYRGLLPPSLLARFGIDPVQWTGAGEQTLVFLHAEPGADKVLISARSTSAEDDEFLTFELADNALNAKNERFSEERLLATAMQSSASAGTLLNSLVSALDTHIAGFEQFDDITLMTVHRKT